MQINETNLNTLRLISSSGVKIARLVKFRRGDGWWPTVATVMKLAILIDDFFFEKL